MSTVKQAAISYFGLPEGATLVEGGPVGHFAFVIPLTEEHLRGIADRMKTLSESVPQPERGDVITMAPTRDELRAKWNDLTQKEQGRYGSFGRYCAQMAVDTDHAVSLMYRNEASDSRQVQHIDAPVEDEPGLPDAVWMNWRDLTREQIGMASDTNGEIHLIQVAMLTEEQRIKYEGGAR